MSVDDLPADWSRRPLTEAELVPDVLDLVVANRDRCARSLCLLMCDDEDLLVRPVAISEMAAVTSQTERVRGLRVLIGAMGHRVPSWSPWRGRPV